MSLGFAKDLLISFLEKDALNDAVLYNTNPPNFTTNGWEPTEIDKDYRCSISFGVNFKLKPYFVEIVTDSSGCQSRNELQRILYRNIDSIELTSGLTPHDLFAVTLPVVDYNSTTSGGCSSPTRIRNHHYVSSQGSRTVDALSRHISFGKGRRGSSKYKSRQGSTYREETVQQNNNSVASFFDYEKFRSIIIRTKDLKTIRIDVPIIDRRDDIEKEVNDGGKKTEHHSKCAKSTTTENDCIQFVNSVRKLAAIEDVQFSLAFHLANEFDAISRVSRKRESSLHQQNCLPHLTIDKNIHNCKERTCKLWRISKVNENYKICKSYPEHVIVPNCITDEKLIHSAAFRQHGRFPVLSYQHHNGNTLVRCSQPLIGPNNHSCKDDEALLEAYIHANSSSCFETSSSHRQMAIQKPSAASHPTAENQGASSGFIVDTRTPNAAAREKSKGGGFEHVTEDAPRNAYKDLGLTEQITNFLSTYALINPSISNSARSNSTVTNNGTTNPFGFAEYRHFKRLHASIDRYFYFLDSYSKLIEDACQSTCGLIYDFCSLSSSTQSNSRILESSSTDMMSACCHCLGCGGQKQKQINNFHKNDHHKEDLRSSRHATSMISGATTDCNNNTFRSRSYSRNKKNNSVISDLSSETESIRKRAQTITTTTKPPSPTPAICSAKPALDDEKKVMKCSAVTRCISAPFSWGCIDQWLSKLTMSCWLTHVKDVLKGACLVAQCMDRERGPVIIHGSEGLDVTLCITSLSQIMLNPNCRTIEGFKSLIEREWIYGGHPFWSRATTGPFNKSSIAFKSNVYAPTFTLFLDCVHQLMRQFMLSFEFTDAFLIWLSDEAYTSCERTFLADNVMERCKILNLKSSTPIWNEQELKKRRHEFKNYAFTHNKSIIWPSVAPMSLKLWKSKYLRYMIPNEYSANERRQNEKMKKLMSDVKFGMRRSKKLREELAHWKSKRKELLNVNKTKC